MPVENTADAGFHCPCNGRLACLFLGRTGGPRYEVYACVRCGFQWGSKTSPKLSTDAE